MVDNSENTMSIDISDVAKLVANNIDTRLAYLDRKFRLTWMNNSFLKSDGRAVDQLIGKSYFDLFPGSVDRTILQNVLVGGQEFVIKDRPYQYPLKPELGITYWDVTLTPVKDASGEANGIVLSLVETTKRKGTEIQLERIAKEWRETFDRIPDFISIHDTNYRIIRANLALSQALKKKPQEIVGRLCYEILHNTHEPWHSCPHRKTIESRSVSHEEFYEPALDLYLEVITSPIIDEQGQLFGSVHIARNTTKRRVAEKALFESEKRHRELIETMQEGVWLIDKDANTTFANPRMAVMLGYTPEEMHGKNLLDFTDEHGKEIANYYLERRQRGIKERHEFEFIKKDGTRIYTSLDTSPLNDNFGNYIGASAVIEDITERKQHEVELDRLYQEEKALRSKLEDELKKRIDFTHALVHELKTPLTPIVNSSEMLIRELKEERLSRLAKNVYGGALDLDHRVDELLDLARIEVGMVTLKLQPVDVLAMINENVGYMVPQVLGKEQSISIHLPDSLPDISADLSRLKQVLMNLIGNASRHTAPKSKIMVRARQEDDNIIIEVQDNGQGISEEMQKHLFDPYFRIENSHDHIGGLGLGLPIAKNIVELHGGRMWVRSGIGKGSTFGFSIPINRPNSNSTETLEENNENTGD